MSSFGPVLVSVFAGAGIMRRSDYDGAQMTEAGWRP